MADQSRDPTDHIAERREVVLQRFGSAAWIHPILVSIRRMFPYANNGDSMMTVDR
jgi:hypothetical protein